MRWIWQLARKNAHNQLFDWMESYVKMDGFDRLVRKKFCKINSSGGLVSEKLREISQYSVEMRDKHVKIKMKILKPCPM